MLHLKGWYLNKRKKISVISQSNHMLPRFLLKETLAADLRTWKQCETSLARVCMQPCMGWKWGMCWGKVRMELQRLPGLVLLHMSLSCSAAMLSEVLHGPLSHWLWTSTRIAALLVGQGYVSSRQNSWHFSQMGVEPLKICDFKGAIQRRVTQSQRDLED